MSRRRVIGSWALALFLVLALASFCSSDVAGLDPESSVRSTGDSPGSTDPATLDDAVIEIRSMIDQGRSREEIAARVTEIADSRITNANSWERLSIGWNWLSLVVKSDEDKVFGRWRDQGGGDKTYEEAADWVWESRYGQCSENASLTYYLLKKAGIEDARIFTQGDHAFVVWGMGAEADPSEPGSWSDDVVVLDSWQGQTLVGQNGFNDPVSGGGGKGIEDATFLKDPQASPPCGYRSTSSVRYPCCESPPYAPCRGTPRLVCRGGLCVSCGSVDMPCCDGSVCPFDTVVCQGDMCVWCGKEGQACCQDQTCSLDALVCQGGQCVSCGKDAQPCCSGGACDSGLQCQEGVCAPPATATSTPMPTATATATPTPTPTPAATPTATVTPTRDESGTPAYTPTPSASPTPYTLGIFTVSIVPPNPAPDQDYQVVVTVSPAAAGTLIEVQISGTDGFGYADSAVTGEDGSVSFGPIPGGEKGVVDTVIVTAPELEQQETFVFTF